MKMQYGLNDKIIMAIKDLAQRYALHKVILFGSRARGDNRERSDIDLAVSGGNTTVLPLKQKPRSPPCCSWTL